MRDNATTVAFSKAQLIAAINAVDDWAEANATSYNNALPVAVRTNATTAQKALLLAYVCMRRAGVLRAQED